MGIGVTKNGTAFGEKRIVMTIYGLKRVIGSGS